VPRHPFRRRIVAFGGDVAPDSIAGS
jgi:hypothetical protein